MKHLITYFILVILISCSSSHLKINDGELINKKYLDTIYYQNRFDFIVLKVNVNGKKKDLIFDTGADILILEKDSSIIKRNAIAKVTDSNGKSTRNYIDVIKEFNISNLKYTNLNAVRVDLSKPLRCISDGIMGNNVIKKCNWQIQDYKLIVSNNPFNMDGSNSIDLFYYPSNRLSANFLINGYHFDTCLIDYGGRFEIELPVKYYDILRNNSKNINLITKKISSVWGVNGKSNSDTLSIINVNIDFCGILMDSVNFIFSKSIKEPMIGLQLLNRFKSVTINNNSRKIYFELPILQKKKVFQELPFSVDLDSTCFIVDSKALNDKHFLEINVGDKYKKINGKEVTSFNTYCEFMEWRQNLMKTESFDITTIDNREIKISNFH